MTEPSDDSLTLKAVTVLEQFSRILQSTCFTADLAPVQWSALRFISRAAPEQRTQAGLAAFSGVRTSSACRTVALLKRKGLVAVKPGADGGRQMYIELTEAGRSLLTRDPLRNLTDMVAGMDRGEKTRLLDRLGQMSAQLLSLSGKKSAPPPGD
jgi:DNA-binding MarR family transcriptional regulator